LNSYLQSRWLSPSETIHSDVMPHAKSRRRTSSRSRWKNSRWTSMDTKSEPKPARSRPNYISAKSSDACTGFRLSSNHTVSIRTNSESKTTTSQRKRARCIIRRHAKTFWRNWTTCLNRQRKTCQTHRMKPSRARGSSVTTNSRSKLATTYKNHWSPNQEKAPVSTPQVAGRGFRLTKFNKDYTNSVPSRSPCFLGHKNANDPPPDGPGWYGTGRSLLGSGASRARGKAPKRAASATEAPG